MENSVMGPASLHGSNSTSDSEDETGSYRPDVSSEVDENKAPMDLTDADSVHSEGFTITGESMESLKSIHSSMKK